MRIAVIGAGAVGRAIGRGWSKAGYDVIYGVRALGDESLNAHITRFGGRAAPSPEAAAEGEVVVLALPWRGAQAAIATLGPLAGKVVIDCMNPLGMIDGKLGLDRGFTTSGGETVASWLAQARVVKTLNQVGAEIMGDAATLIGRPVMFVAGDDAGAKTTAAKLVEALGFEALDAGALAQARLLEPLAMVWINQALARGLGRAWALGVIRPA